ncbi:polymer-forming cytoskeletal protein [Paenibacillus sp. MMS20-IR301]|uniref:bactofilin family protein n=1 Tax=Paenibacillus sp. MMS20-IR301 TaxID=2895946 RepID=UPI0028EDCC9C|nr:polymer-forming cytoskeletal protein [Paenibacillus sp. MMS20-IR301]WNS41243.1 polymer-forming cytoskeletal protein [Paenibacillus sp. MMS20-IR301]
MWNKRKASPSYKSTDSLIGHGGTLEGKVNCDTNLRIEGNFSGEILCQGTVTVGEQGMVHSSIKAQEIVIAGKVYGDVTAGRKLIMTGTGQLHGNIAAAALSIMEGSILNGAVAMTEQPAAEEAGRTVPAGRKDKSGKRGSNQSSLEGA